MTDPPTPYTFDRVVRLVLTVIVLAALIALLRHLSDVLIPFAAAVVLAYLLNPIVTAVERRTKRRGISVALTLSGLGIFGLAMVAILIPLMAYQVGQFREALERLQTDLAASAAAAVTVPNVSDTQTTQGDVRTAFGWRELKDAWRRYHRDAGSLPRSERLARLRSDLAGTYLGDLLERTIEYTRSEEFNRMLVQLAKRVAVGGWTVVTFLVNLVLGLTGLIVVLLYLIFLLVDYPEYARRWRAFLPPAYRETIIEFYEQFSLAMRRYFRGQALIALLVGTLCSIGFTLIGLPMAVPFGLFVGLLNMVPYLQTVGLVPGLMLAALRAIERDSSFLASIGWVLLVFAVVQIIQDTLLTPRIMGKATGLKPVAVLLGVFVWGKLLGFLGLILAIPLTCLGIATYRRYVLRLDEAEG
ncbi:MAG: AI-2E family transporter [Planctomycetota bacterium]|nr:MAG: AI-2E family transporter [Planctomycetota bacterium]